MNYVSVQPVRACLSGEDLDWVGGRSVCVGVELKTIVTTGTDAPEPVAAKRIPVQPWAGQVWNHLRERLSGLDDDPPPVAAWAQGPTAGGLSSSTALILGIFEAFCAHAGARVDVPTLMRWAYEFEFAVFGGGGMDHMAITHSGVTLFRGRERGLPDLAGQIRFPGEWAILVVDSGTPKDTRQHVRFVRGQIAARDPLLDTYIRITSQVTDAVWTAIGARDLNTVADGMHIAHAAMRDCQRMSTPRLEQIRTLAWETTRIRLKLSGAGSGGALVGVCTRDDAEQAAAALTPRLRAEVPGARAIVAEAAAPRHISGSTAAEYS
jgi:galactokinase